MVSNMRWTRVLAAAWAAVILLVQCPHSVQAAAQSILRCPGSKRCGFVSVTMHSGSGAQCVESCVFLPLLQRSKTCGSCPATTTTPPPPIAPAPTAPTAPTAPPAFAIDVQFLSGISAGDQAIFNTAKARWESVIVGDKSDFATAGISLKSLESGCVLPNTIDDLYICANYKAIDGNDNIVGIAGPNMSRQDGTAVIGSMTFDSADIALLKNSNSLGSTILHEMGHVLGTTACGIAVLSFENNVV
jgi:hypothetical protein